MSGLEANAPLPSERLNLLLNSTHFHLKKTTKFYRCPTKTQRILSNLNAGIGTTFSCAQLQLIASAISLKSFRYQYHVLLARTVRSPTDVRSGARQRASASTSHQSGFDTIAHTQLQHDVGHVMFDGLLGQLQRARDFLVGHTLGNQLKDLVFTRR